MCCAVDNPQSHQEQSTMRLQKYLARAGVDSRRHCEQLIAEGRVSVNGVVRSEMGIQINPLNDVIEVDGKLIAGPVKAVTIMLNKPAGYITAMSDKFGHDCISELVPLDIYPGLYPLGRLDAQTTGLILFSTDGTLGPALLHPSHHVNKTYEARVEGFLSDKEAERLENGVELGDGMTQPATVDILERSDEYSVVRLGIHEGRNRQVRRMLKSVGHPVVELKRLSFGPLKLGNLDEGAWRIVEGEELSRLYAAADNKC